MQIHVARDGKELGSFSVDDVRAGLSSGKFLPTDFGWMDGQSDWARLPALPGLAPAPQPAAEQTSAPLAEEIEQTLPASTKPEARAAHPKTTGTRVPLSKPVHGAPAASLAVVSLVCGVLSLSVIPLLPALPAIVCGHLARGQIRRSAGTLGGEGAALGGLITGYLSIFIFGLIGALIFALAAGTALPE
jgi:hypothetical protein